MNVIRKSRFSIRDIFACFINFREYPDKRKQETAQKEADTPDIRGNQYEPLVVPDGVYFYMDCADKAVNDGIFPASEFEDEDEAVWVAARYGATLYRCEFSGGEQVSDTVLYRPKTERQHAVKRADVASMLDEIEAEVEDGLGYQHQKWKEYVVEGMPKAKLRNRKNQKEEDMANELMIVFPEDGWCYFKTRQETTGAALGEFYNACERAGINMDNVRRPVKTELRVVLDKKKPQDAVNCSDVIAMLDEIKTEVEDGLGYQHQKWKEYVVEEMPEARPRKKRRTPAKQEKEDRANELTLFFPRDGWCYFKTGQGTAISALNEFYDTCERAGINMDNVRRPVKLELRDSSGTPLAIAFSC